MRGMRQRVALTLGALLIAVTVGLARTEHRGAIATVRIEVRPEADTPRVLPVEPVPAGRLSREGVIVLRALVDGPEVGYFRITEIEGARLFRPDDFRLIRDGDFVPAGIAARGLRVLPPLPSPAEDEADAADDTDLVAKASFAVQAALTASVDTLGGDVVRVTIPVTEPPADDAHVQPFALQVVPPPEPFTTQSRPRRSVVVPPGTAVVPDSVMVAPGTRPCPRVPGAARFRGNPATTSVVPQSVTVRPPFRFTPGHPARPCPRSVPVRETRIGLGVGGVTGERPGGTLWFDASHHVVTPSDRLRFDLRHAATLDAEPGTNQRLFAGVNAEHALTTTPNLFAYGRSWWQDYDAAAWDTRWAVFGGLGAVLYEEGTGELRVRTGPAIAWETGNVDRHVVPEWNAGLDVRLQVDERQSLVGEADLFADLDEWGEARGFVRTAWEVALGGWGDVRLRVGVQLETDGTPNGTAPADFDYFVTLSSLFGGSR